MPHAAQLCFLDTYEFGYELNGVPVTKTRTTQPARLPRRRPGRRVARDEPDPNAAPDELLISAIGEHGEYETQYIRHSTMTVGAAAVMTPQMAGLTDLLATIQERLKVVYGRRDDDSFAIDVEFVDAAGKPAVKQARPWVE